MRRRAPSKKKKKQPPPPPPPPSRQRDGATHEPANAPARVHAREKTAGRPPLPRLRAAAGLLYPLSMLFLVCSGIVVGLYTCLLPRRPLLATNLLGIALPALSPLLHLKHLLVSPALEVRVARWGAAYLATPRHAFGRAFGGAVAPGNDNDNDTDNNNNLKNIPPPPPPPPPPEPDYRDDGAWAALHPRLDTADLKSRGWYGDDARAQAETVASQERAPCDLFYLPPTTYFSSAGWNAAFNDTAAQLMVDEAILFQQAAAFGNSCRVYAPRIRQMTAGGYFDRENGAHALALAYQDAERAFVDFLRRRCLGEADREACERRRPIMLASHSQGTTLMERILLQFFAPPALGLRRLLVAAYLIGMEIHDGPYSWSGKDPHIMKQDADLARSRLGGDLLPLCESATQTGCVIAFRTFFSDDDVCDFLSRPVVAATRHKPAQRKVCINPLTWTAMNSGGDSGGVDGDGVVGTSNLALGCMPIIHPWANLHYILYGQGENQSSVERLRGTISDIDTNCKFDAWCTEDGRLRLRMPAASRYWASGFAVPFPAWTVFSFPGQNTHAYDFNFFFNNIRKNAGERLEAWLKTEAG